MTIKSQDRDELLNVFSTTEERDDVLDAMISACKRWNWTKTRFGRESTGDFNLISHLARGRHPRRETVRKVYDFIEWADANPAQREAWRRQKSA